MLRTNFDLPPRGGLFLAGVLLFVRFPLAPDLPTGKANAPEVADASSEGELAIKKFKVPYADKGSTGVSPGYCRIA